MEIKIKIPRKRKTRRKITNLKKKMITVGIESQKRKDTIFSKEKTYKHKQTQLITQRYKNKLQKKKKT
jgi:hypothetical protein